MKKNSVRTNNTHGNIDYTPYMPTDTLNSRVSGNVVNALTVSAGTTVLRGPATGAETLALGMTGALAADAASGQPSASMSITGHDGDTFGHTDCCIS